MDMHPLRTDEDYQAAMAEIDRLFGAVRDTPEGDRFEILILLVEAYEEQHHKVPLPDPIAALEYYLESRGLTRRHLEPYLGSRARVSEVLGRKRALSVGMIRRLHEGLGISADVLIQPYPIRESRPHSDARALSSIAA